MSFSPKNAKTRCQRYFDQCDESGRPYTVSGLALALELTRPQLEREAASNEALAMALLRVENYLEECALGGKASSAAVNCLRDRLPHPVAEEPQGGVIRLSEELFDQGV